MTIMVKTSVGTQKGPGDVMVMPLIEIEEPERPASRPRKQSATSRYLHPTLPVRIWLWLLMLFVTVLVVMGGGAVLIDIMKTYYQKIGYHCAISSTQDMDYVVMKEAPPTASWFGVPSTEMRVYSSGSDLISANILNNLLEDMSIEDDVENIYVHDGPRSFRVIHDFNENYTNIISAQRCFLMEMIRQFVLEPSSLMASFRNQSGLDTSHAHTVFAAALPDVRSLPSLPAAARPCLADNKPVYRLTLQGTHVLRKRSVEVRTEAPPTTEPPTQNANQNATQNANQNATQPATEHAPEQDFVQFSGKHLQRITISNLDDVVRYERASRQDLSQ